MPAIEKGTLDIALLPPAGCDVVYHIYDGDALLYVGVSNNLLGRLGQHSKSSWFRYGYPTRVEWFEFESRVSAEFAEAQDIARLQPSHNVAGVEIRV